MRPDKIPDQESKDESDRLPFIQDWNEEIDKEIFSY